MSLIVPNRPPIYPSSKRVAVIGEAPGAEEIRLGRPFVGSSGRFLAALLSRAGLNLDACFVGNVCQHQPPGNDISLFSWNGLQIQHGLDKLRSDLDAYKPHICVLLGNVPLKAFKDPMTDHPLKPNAFRNKASQWRGSLFASSPDAPLPGVKCITSYHPTYVLRDYEAAPLLQFDLKKAVREGGFSELMLPQRKLDVDLLPEQILQRLYDIRANRTYIALDIEGGVSGMSCISFATSHTDAFILPFFRKDGTRCFSQYDECRLLRALAEVLEDPDVPKVLQNSLYDRFVLHYAYGIRVRGVVDDTMLKHWELYSELEKSLGVQASLYTDEPYYKGDRKSNDDRAFFEYCCRDSAVTLEISKKLDPLLHGVSLAHYKMNVSLLNPMLYMELRGIRYDVAGAASRRQALLTRMHEVQARLNALTGHRFPWTSKDEVLSHARSLMWTKKGDRVRKEYLDDGQWDRFNHLLSQPCPTLATVGEIEDLCEVSLNVDSSKQFPAYLYETLGLPTQYKENSKGEPAVTADYEALLKLSRELSKHNDPRLAVIHTAIELRALGTRAGMLSISADRDGRIRCGYNIVGSNTGRVTCYESPTGSGYNLQTIPNYTSRTEAPGGILGDRDLFLADPGYWFFQCDLKGADGWTVAAYAAMLGDSTMLEDYLYGLKPANILAIMLRGYDVDWTDRAAIKQASKRIGKDDWDYFACKRVQHGGSYLEGAITISRNILKDSEGKLYMEPKECDKLKGFFFKRYWGISKWHDWVARRLKERSVLTAASGQVRQFFGRPDEILTKAVAFEPQANTTYATNLAMHRLWTDPENRVSESLPHSNGSTKCGQKLRIEPLHQVHDALCGQFKHEDTAWAIARIKSYFDNPLVIAGQKLVIPFDGGYGTSWGNLKEGTI